MHRRGKKKVASLKVPLRDRSRQACGLTAQQEQNSQKLPSNRCNYPQSTVSSRLAEKSTHRQPSFGWVGGWVDGKRKGDVGLKRERERENNQK